MVKNSGGLGVGADETQEAVVFAHGTSVVSEDPLEVRIDGQDHGPADIVELGGGWVEADPAVPDHAPPACLEGDAFLAG